MAALLPGCGRAARRPRRGRTSAPSGAARRRAGRGAAVRRRARTARRARGRRLAAGGRDRQIRSRPQALPRRARHPRPLRLAADRRPPPVEAASVDGAAGDRRGRRSAGNDVVVGDTSFDMAMAAAAGAAPIGAGWGYHEADELIEAGAVAVADGRSKFSPGSGARRWMTTTKARNRLLLYTRGSAERAGDLLHRRRNRLHRTGPAGRLAAGRRDCGHPWHDRCRVRAALHQESLGRTGPARPVKRFWKDVDRERERRPGHSPRRAGGADARAGAADRSDRTPGRGDRGECKRSLKRLIRARCR